MRFKPTYQTAYEFYYTSKPIASKEDSEGDSLNSFTRWYDFKFAKVDCLVNADVCAAHSIQNWPTMVYFQDGKEVQVQKGSKDMASLSKWVEQLLETIRPGSRKEGGPKLPKEGATSVETGPDTKEETKEQVKKEGEHKAAVSSIAKSTPTKAAKPTPAKAKPTSTPNPSGIVEPLTAEKFQKVVTNTMDPWFIKFYAPWCHHCQDLAPTWINLARPMQGKLNIGEVNCEIEKRLCKEAGVRGYPTMLFFRGGERIEYEGLRGYGDLLDYATKANSVGAGVQDVDAAAFKKMEETEEVIFIYFYDHATTSEDFQAMERLTLSLVGHAKLVKTDDPELSKRFKISTWPRLMVSRDGKPSYYSPITPREMRDVKQVLTWMKSVWLPIVPELTSSNAKEIMDGKLVVLGILSRERSDEFVLSKRELKSAALEWIDKQDTAYRLARKELRDAKQLRIEEADDKNDQRALRDAKLIRIDMDQIERTQVGFAWVDGVFWERWIRTTYGIDVKEGERIIVNDESVSSIACFAKTYTNIAQNHRYWDTTASGEPIRLSRSYILETLGKVTKNPPQIPSKSTTGSITGFFLTIHKFFSNHPYIGLGMVVGFFTAATLFGRSRRRGFGKGGFIHLNEKDGLLGGMSNGNSGAKHD
jgi:protein disulfide-isomerase